MKKFMVLVLLIVLPMMARAEDKGWFETNKPVKCGPFREIVQIVISEPFTEQPVWVGTSGTDPTSFTLFVNDKSGTWTLVQYAKEIGCVLGMGPSGKLYIPAGL